MKKSLVALAVLAAAGAASAQSSVTLFGVVDASVSYYSVSSKTNTVVNPLTGLPVGLGVFTPSKSQTVLANGANSSSRLGFRGTEDLGGGLAASFWLEAPLSNDDGSAVRPFNFGRRSTVSLSGGFGEVRLGRDYTPTFWNNTVFDPFGTVGVGTNVIQQVNGLNRTNRPLLTNLADPNGTRASNSIGYFLPPNLGGFYGQFMYALHENVQTDAQVAGTTAFTGIGSTRGRYVGGRVGYANGPVDVAVSYGESTLANPAGTLGLGPVTAANFINAYKSKIKTANIGASWDFGVVKLVGELSQTKTTFDQDAITFGGVVFPAISDSSKNKGFLLGALVPVGPGQIKVSYSRVKTTNPSVLAGTFGGLPIFTQTSPTASKFALGYVHNLSKRTALYATIAHISNKNGSALPINSGVDSVNPVTGTTNASSRGYDIGLRHSF